MHTTNLRIAILLPDKRTNAPGEQLLCDLYQQNFSPIIFRIDLEKHAPVQLYTAYRFLDYCLFGKRHRGFDAQPPLDAVKSIRLPATAQWENSLLQAVQKASLDLLVTPGRLELPDAVLAAFRLGCLELDHLEFATGDAPEAFHALACGRTTWEPRLLWRQAGSPPRLLYRSPSAVFSLSLERTRAPACAKSLQFVSRMVRLYREHGLAAWESRAEPASNFPAMDSPDTWAMCRFIPKLCARHLRAAYDDIRARPQWFVAVRRGIDDPLQLGGMTELSPPDARGWADPFPIMHEGRCYLFVEEIDPVTDRGHIAVMVEQKDGRFSAPQTVLRPPYHVSYPFVFAWNGSMYMIPETAQAGEVALYKARPFPWHWERVGVLLDHVRAVDATVFEHAGRWWLMANIRPKGGSSWDELSVFYADTPYGPYQAHPGNPVVSDVSRARPAGRVFTRSGQLYRPAQDCAGQYGRALVINAITTLSPTAYAEQVVARHEAHLLPGSDSLHTYNSVPGLEVVDGRRLRPRWNRKRGARS